MELRSAAIDVHPPRSKRWFKPTRGVVRQRYAMRERFNEMVGGWRKQQEGRSQFTEISWQLLLHLLLPGLGQFYLGRRVRGWVFLCVWGMAFLLALVMVGTIWGNLALGMMISIHASSVSDAIVTPGGTVRDSIVVGIGMYIAVGVFIYGPLAWLTTRYVRPYTVQVNMVYFDEGDVLLLHPTQHPGRGSVVVYELDTDRMMAGTNRYVEARGATVDRVLGLPGDMLESTKGGLRVNGELVSYQPLGRALPEFKVKVPEGMYYIWPSQLARLMGGGNGSVVGVDLAKVSADRIEGEILLRTHPWSRFGRLK